MLTSFTSNVSRDGASTATSMTEADQSPLSSGQKEEEWDFESPRKVQPEDIPQHFSSDFDTDIELTQPVEEDSFVEATHDPWLRRRSSPELPGTMSVPKLQMPDPSMFSVKRQIMDRAEPVEECPSSWNFLTQLDDNVRPDTTRLDDVVTHLPAIAEDHDSGRFSEHYRVRDLPQQGLFASDIQYIHDLLVNHNTSPRLAYELCRLALAGPANPDIMMSSVLPVITSDNDEQFWEYVQDLQRDEMREQGILLPSLPSTGAWKAAGRGSEHVIRNARLRFARAKSESIFELILDPLQEEATSNRFFRHFGAHRFLRLMTPSLKTVPDYLNSSKEQLHVRIRQWLEAPDKEFMGYSWSVFHTREHRTKKSKIRNDEDSEDKGYEVMLFATEGPGLKHITVHELLNWFIPIDLNKHQSSCKAFARLELGLSKTYATVVFEPSQIIWANDILADGQVEDQSYRDKSLREKCAADIHDKSDPKVMNDGCARISYAAAQKVWSMLDEDGPCPSAFQGRIGPWKSIWMLSDQVTSQDEIWLEVNKSQQKFEVHPEDLCDNTRDVNRLTFEVISWSRSPSKSRLYVDFLPILESRGVSRKTLSDFVANCMDEEKQEVDMAQKGKIQLSKWVQENLSSESRIATATELQEIQLPSEKVLKMLAAGFEPTSKYLAQTLRGLKSQHYTRISSSLNIPIPRSTSLYGVADPTGCLAPGEVHLVFSSHFGEEGLPFLHDMEVLVARHPALRPSDIQKVRAVFKLELRHLVDVVVFPTRGRYPLAGKLQGGDYDGDKFWVCWQESIVKPFRNAPLPIDAHITPEKLGITIDRTKIGDIFEPTTSRKDATSDFLARSFKFAWQPNLLGVSTSYFSEMCYSTNAIDSDNHRLYASLHDYLVDSTKNGYTFVEEDWRNFKLNHAAPGVKMIPPAYKAAPNLQLTDAFNRPNKVKYKPENIVDYLVFHIARPKALAFVQESPPSSASDEHADDCLTDFFLGTMKNKDANMSHIVKTLRTDRDAIINQYKKHLTWASKGNHEREYETKLRDDARQKAAADYKALLPANADDIGTSKAWLTRAAPKSPSLWDLLKASAAAATEPQFAYTVAGPLLCYIKAHSNPHASPIPVVPEVYNVLKVKKKAGKVGSRFEELEVENAVAEEEVAAAAGKAVVMAVVKGERDADGDEDMGRERGSSEDGDVEVPFFDAPTSPIKIAP